MMTRQQHHHHHGEGEDDAENRTGVEDLCGDVAAYALGVLDPAQQKIFAQHLTGCEGCQRDAADFGMFAPVLRQVVSRPVASRPCRITRSILVLAAGFVVAVAAVLSVVESLATHVDDPVGVNFGNQALVQMESLAPFGHR